MRGKQIAPRSRKARCRITPAGAGKTDASANRAGAGRDHPRRCGENKDLSPNIGGGRGSPPQVRGKQDAEPIAKAGDRITPAGAGKTRKDVLQGEPAADHPRRCGENRFGRQSAPAHRGSPPQVRGKPDFLPPKACWCRITPAGAGKTQP